MKKILLPLGVLFLLPWIAQAQVCEWVCTDAGGNEVEQDYSGQLRLSEVLPDPEGDDTQYEFIEIENISSRAVELSGWTLEDASGRRYNMQEGSLARGSFVALYRTTTKISLNNTDGDEVRLYDPAGILQDELQYEDSAEEEFSYSRSGSEWFWTTAITPNAKNEIVIPNNPPELEVDYPDDVFAHHDITFSADMSSDPDGDALSAVWTIDGVAKAGLTISHAFSSSGDHEASVELTDGRGGVVSETYVIPVLAYDVSDSIRISELYPKPNDGEDEFIELINTGDRLVELSGWQVTDGSKMFTFADQTIDAGGFFLLNRAESKIALNDTGDSITLFCVDGTEKDSVSYASAERGKSYAKLQDGWEWRTPTPGFANPEDEGAVLGATALSDVPGAGDAEHAVGVQSETFLQTYGAYLAGSFFAVAIGVSLYRKWKEGKAADDDAGGPS